MQPHEAMAFFTACFPKALTAELAAISPQSLLEIRLRANRPAQYRTYEGLIQGRLITGERDVRLIAEALSEHTLYARYDEARRGFITLRGGHRMGLCGGVMSEGGMVSELTDIASFCVRIAREVHGAADSVIPYLDKLDATGGILVLGGPGTGKTTLIRDLARTLSNQGATIAINDERGELAACSRGVPQLDVGRSTDVLDGAAKPYGIRWLIRSMAPKWVVTDEINGVEDAAAISEAQASGVRVLASVHASSLPDVRARADLAPLFGRRVFQLFVQLKNGSAGVIEKLYDGEGSPWP